MSSERSVIRHATDEDLHRIREINQANVPGVGPLEPARWPDLLAGCAFALVVESGDRTQIAGFCVVFGQGAAYRSANYRWFMDRYDDAMYLDRVAFDERFQGQGLGTQLYAEVDRLISTDHPSMARLTLEVNIEPPNPQSMAFHTRLGFVEVGRQFTGNGHEVSLMERPIAAC